MSGLNSTNAKMLLRLVACIEGHEYIIVSLCLSGVTIASTIFGNLLIIVAYIKTPNLRGSMFLLILNLAVADLLLGTTLLLHPLEKIFPDLGENKYFCLTRSFLLYASILQSNQILLLMSIDRVLAVMFPLLYHVHFKLSKKLHVIIGLMWIVAFSVWIPFFAVKKYKDVFDSEVQVICSLSGFALDNYNTVGVIGLWVVCIVIGVLYIVLIITIKVQTRRLRNHTCTRRRAARTKLMLIVYIVFCVCWVPVLVINSIILISPIERIRLICVSQWILHIGFANSGLNWIIYGAKNRKFQKAFKSLFQIPISGKSSSVYAHSVHNTVETTVTTVCMTSS